MKKRQKNLVAVTATTKADKATTTESASKSSQDSGVAARLDWPLVGLMLAVKMLVLVCGLQAFKIFQNKSLQSFYNWLEIWNRWDAPHYLDIARSGYVATGVESRWIVFYPLYPWLVRFCAYVVQDYLVSAFVVSTLASVAAGLLLQKLAALDETTAVARASVFFLYIFPTSYFLHIGYTESLFLALALGSFLAARRRRWWLAGTLGALASLARINGLLLVPALAAEAFLQYRDEERRVDFRWLWIALTGAGFACYLLINEHVLGDPFAFLTVQNQHWSKSLTWPWVGIGDAWRSALKRAPAEAQMVGWQELFFVFLGLGCTVLCALRLRLSYTVWMACNWLLWTSTKFILSVPRYTLIMFPVYLLFAQAAVKRPVWGGIVAVWSLLFLALFTSLFAQGKWAF